MKGFSRHNYNAERRSEMSWIFMVADIAKVTIGFLVLPLGGYLAAIFCTSGLMMAGLAKGVSLSGSFTGYLPRQRHFSPCTSIFTPPRLTRTRNRARTYRRANRSKAAFTSRGDSENGESDPGDPPGPLLSRAILCNNFPVSNRCVTIFLLCHSQTLRPVRIDAPDWWCLR